MVPRLSSADSRPASTLVCACSGLAVSFVFWPYKTGFLAYFVLIPFIVLSGLRHREGRYLLNCYVFGFGYFMGSLYWIAMLDAEQIAAPWLRFPAALLLCLYLSLFILVLGFLTRRMVRLGLPHEVSLPLAWWAVEHLRSLGPLGFPWASLGYSQTPYPSVIQQASVVGTYGISAWLVLINVLLARAATSRRVQSLAVAAVVFGLPVAAGMIVLGRAPSGEGVSVSLVQPNIPGAVKWDDEFREEAVDILARMTRQAPPAEMIVWPETAVPTYLKHDASYMDSVRAIAVETRSYLLLGFPDYVRVGKRLTFFNSAMLLAPQGEEVGEYRKIHLVPFGEMIPFEDRIPVLRRIDLGEGDFSPGETYRIFDLDGKRFAVAICFESIYPSLAREFAGRGAQFIVNITNDEWFGPSLGPSQHAEMAVMRCVECRVGLARCANTGVSMLVDAFGRVTGRTRLFEPAVLAGRVECGRGGTPYLKWGGALEGALTAVVIALAALSYVMRQRAESI